MSQKVTIGNLHWIVLTHLSRHSWPRKVKFSKNWYDIFRDWDPGYKNWYDNFWDQDRPCFQSRPCLLPGIKCTKILGLDESFCQGSPTVNQNKLEYSFMTQVGILAFVQKLLGRKARGEKRSARKLRMWTLRTVWFAAAPPPLPPPTTAPSGAPQ
jgi:hypothetical protein